MASRKDKIMQMVKDMNKKKFAESESEMSNRPTAIIAENVSLVEGETTSNLDSTMNDVTEPPNLNLDQNNESFNLLNYNDLCIENQSFNDYSVISIPDNSDINLNTFIMNDESDCEFFTNFEENRIIVVDTTSDVGFQQGVATQNQQIQLNEIPITFSVDVGLQQDDHNYYKISSLSEPDEMDANSYNPIPNTTIDDGTSLQSLENNATNNENDKEQCCSNDNTFLSKETDPDYEPSSSGDGSEDETQRQTFQPEIEELPLPLTNNENNVDVQNKRKRRKRQHVNEEDWSVNRNKAAREKGKRYLGKIFKNGKWIYDLPKDERKIKERCQCKQKEKNKIQCNMVTDEERQKIFNKFWNMSWKEKKFIWIYLSLFNLHLEHEIEKMRLPSRRESSYLYFLEKNQEKIRVCKTMFLATMGIGERAMRNWKKDSNTYDKEQNSSEIVGQEDPDSASIPNSACKKYQQLSEARNKKIRQSN